MPPAPQLPRLKLQHRPQILGPQGPWRLGCSLGLGAESMVGARCRGGGLAQRCRVVERVGRRSRICFVILSGSIPEAGLIIQLDRKSVV